MTKIKVVQQAPLLWERLLHIKANISYVAGYGLIVLSALRSRQLYAVTHSSAVGKVPKYKS
jgi:hypothetical protein